MYNTRLLEKTLEKARKTFPVIVITGPRQSGKSTILENFLKNSVGSYISVEDSRNRSFLEENPHGYLQNKRFPIVLDEIQYMPELLTTVKTLVDENRSPGQWYITGSQQFPLMKNVSESLAGRAAVFTLPPFGLKERTDVKGISDFIFKSSYPEVAVNASIDAALWYSSYLQTYLERDVRGILQVPDLRDFERFIKLLATRVGYELNASKLAQEVGVSVPTIKRWVSVLETSGIVFLVPPFFKNLGKRIIKSSRVYFYDNGLLNFLLGYRDVVYTMASPHAGMIFENAVVSEIAKREWAKGVKPEIYFWRSQAGVEIDLIVAEEGTYIPYEIKQSDIIKPLFYKNLLYWLKLTNEKKLWGCLITDCKNSSGLPSLIRNIHWSEL